MPRKELIRTSGVGGGRVGERSLIERYGRRERGGSNSDIRENLDGAIYVRGAASV